MNIQYFGTDLRNSGHYLHQVHDTALVAIRGMVKRTDFPIHPESICDYGVTSLNGQVDRIIANEYKMIAIVGSPADARAGSKSIFITKDDVTLAEFEEHIKEHSVCKQIIAALSAKFTINW